MGCSTELKSNQLNIFKTRKWLIDSGLPVSDLEKTPELDVCIDGADEVDVNLNCIKGGGGCLTQEKIVQNSSKKFIVSLISYFNFLF